MKKRVLSLVLVMALCLGMGIPVSAAGDAERGVLRYEEIIAPQYEDAQRFSDGLTAVKQNGKWGYIDYDNNLVIPCKYDVANPFSEGYAVVGNYSTRKNWDGEDESVIELGFINDSGNYKPFRGSLYVMDDSGYVYTKTDYYVTSAYFDLSVDYCFYGGWVSINNHIFDTAGNQFGGGDDDSYWQPVRVFTEGLAVAWPTYTTGVAYLDINGNTVFDFSDTYTEIAGGYKYISNAYPFNQGLALVWECTVLEANDYEATYKFGLIDKSGNWVISPQYDNYRYMGTNRYQLFADNGLFSVDKDGKSGCIDKTGKVVIPFQYDRVWSFFEGLAVFELGGKSGYLDSAGNVVIPATYEKAGGFYNGYAVVYDGTKAFLIDRYGNAIPGADMLNPNTYFVEHEDGSSTVYTPDEYVVITENGKYGYGHIAYLPPLPDRSEMSDWAYDEVVAAIEEELVPVSLQNLYRNNINREEFSELVIEAVCETLGVERDELIQKRTGKKLSAWVSEYPFYDTANSDVIAAYALGIVDGYGDGTFRPYSNITRQEAAALLTRSAKALGMDTSNPKSVSFADSGSVASWAIDSINFVNQINVMTGTGSNAFSPLGSYTREQSFMTIYRLFLAAVGQ